MAKKNPLSQYDKFNLPVLGNTALAKVSPGVYLVEVARLQDDPRNPRTITEGELQNLRDSIRRNTDFLVSRPVMASMRTGQLVVIAGRHRKIAAELEGYRYVPTFVYPMTEAQEKEWFIRDNTHNATFDLPKLKEHFGDVNLQEFGLVMPGLQAMTERQVTFNVTEKPQRWIIMLEFETEQELEQEHKKLASQGYKTKIVA